MLSCRSKILTAIFTFFLFFMIGAKTTASSNNSSKVEVSTEFLENISGGNKFVFNVGIDSDLNGVVKEFFVEDGQKVIPVSTYELSKNKYVIVVTLGSKEYSINNLKLGVTLVVNRSEENVRGIASLSAENKTFKGGQAVGDPVLLYNEQDKITIAIEIDDPWDTLKNVQATLVYPEFTKDFNMSFEKKHLIVSGKLKQYVYIVMGNFKEREVLKFNLNLLFQRGLNDVSLRGESKTFLYNFNVEDIVEDIIRSVYMNLMNRQATDSEISKYSKSLIDNFMSTTKFVKSIIDSKEFKNISMSDGDFVTRIYKITLKRLPDEDGKSFWVNEIKKTSRSNVLVQMFKSDEYVRLMSEIGLAA